MTMMTNIKANNDIVVDLGLGYSEVYNRFCFNCGYDFKESSVGVQNLLKCPGCDEPIRMPLILMG